MSGTITIRRAAAGDTQAILDCLASAFEPYRLSYTVEAFADTTLTAETILQRLSSMSVFVAVGEGGKIVGTIACSVVTADEGHLRGMAVPPEWQGGDIAERLLQSAEDELRRMKVSRITLDTTEPLWRAKGFYEKHGYRASGKVSDFFGMPLHEYAKYLRS